MKISKEIFIIIIILLTTIPFSSNSSNILVNKNLLNYDEHSNNIVLLTGFGPFLSYDVNPSQLIVESLNQTYIDNVKIIGIILPVDFDDSVTKIIKEIRYYNPSIVISIGLSPSAKKIEIEKIGINFKRYILDNGRWSFPVIIEKNGPFIRLSTLPTKDIVNSINENKIRVCHSFSAGTYICNALLYETLGYIKNQNLSTNVGFIHIPKIKTETYNGMNLDTMIDAVKIAINVSINNQFKNK